MVKLRNRPAAHAMPAALGWVMRRCSGHGRRLLRQRCSTPEVAINATEIPGSKSWRMCTNERGQYHIPIVSCIAKRSVLASLLP
jgi:hypothetical protein